MRDSTKEIFEKHEVRKTKEQRKAFRDYIVAYAKSLGYEARVESLGKAHNVIVGDPNKAEVLYTAHYDTCSVLPFPNFITPKCVPIYILYQVILSLIIYIVPISVMIGSRHVLNATESNSLFILTLLGGYVLLILTSFLFIAGPANKHTANDNTSGVTLLIDIMTDIPDEMKGKVAYIFFDLEERGLVGSKLYAKKHKTIAKNTPVINFDCVSDGNNILFVAKKGASDLASKLEDAFISNDKYSVEVVTKGAFYPSDQKNFTKGVGVAALNKFKCGILYMDKIHTPKDTVYDEENIEFLKCGAIKLVGLFAKG